MDSNSLIHQVQSGFHPMHCTQDILLKTIVDWKISLDQGHIVGAVMIDLSKAFDSNNHQLLLTKLSIHGIHGVQKRGVQTISTKGGRGWYGKAHHQTGLVYSLVCIRVLFLAHLSSSSFSMTFPT